MSSPMTVSFVVPTYNSARTIGACAQSLVSQTWPHVEVVVVDNDSKDDTWRIASRWTPHVENRGPERCAQRNHGAAVSTGDIVVFVDSDMVFEPTIAAEIVAQFTEHPELGALVIPERSFGDGFLVKCRVMEKALYVGDEGVEAPRAFRREVFEQVGGWNEELTAAEDWDLADRTRAAGVGVGRVPSFIWHDEGHITLRSTFSKKRYYGRWISAYLKAHEGEGSRKLKRTALFSQPGTLLRDPVHAGGMFVLKGVEAAGLVAGMRDAKSNPVVLTPRASVVGSGAASTP